MSDDGQLELGLPAEDAARRSLLIARVAVDTPLPHLDRPFDYLVPEELDRDAVPGCRVKVRFAGRLTHGFVLERGTSSEHTGKLAPIAKVVSPEPVLAPEIVTLARAVADRWAGTLSDVLRLAVPPRHARTEKAARPAPPAADLPDLSESDAFPSALRNRLPARAVRSVLPSEQPAEIVARAVLATLHGGRGAVVCVPDVTDLAEWDAVFTAVLGAGRHVLLSASQGPAARYRAFLAARRGDVRVVLGTRAAAWAPVVELGLVAMWDDGDDLFAEPRAPYAHAREVLLTRALDHEAGVLLAGHARSVEAQALVESGWCVDISPSDGERRAAWVRPLITDGSTHGRAPVRLPTEVFGAIRQAEGAVLVQVPRRGYRASLRCGDCRTPTQCEACGGPLAQPSAQAPLQCRWCGTRVDPWRCPACGSTKLRSGVMGQVRTAEEYTRAFADHEVVTSGGSTVLSEVEPGRRIVLATPGAEPRVAGGYAVVVLMDTWLALGRDDVRVVEEAHRRWFNAMALTAPDGRAIAVGDATLLRALVHADPAGLATRELAERRATHLPPAGRLATLETDPSTIEQLATRAWTPHTEVLGPVPVDLRDATAQRLVLRAPRAEGTALSDALKQVAAERSAAKLPPVRIQVDPLTF